MIRNYFRIAWRNLWKNKTFTALNLGALTISLASCLIIYFWVTDELSYDRSGSNADRVFRVALKLETNNQPVKEFAVTAAPLAPVLVKDFPEIEKAVRINGDNPLIGYEDHHFFCDEFFYADSTFFEVFGYPLLKGDPHTVLKNNNSAVITERMAKRLFGKNDPLGKMITMNDTTLLTITGIAKDLSPNNHFVFDIITSFNVIERQIGPAGMANWWNDSYYTYLLLKNPADAPVLNTKISDIIDKYNGEQNKAFGLKGTHYLQTLKSIHLHSDLRSELNTNGNLKSLRIFIGIAVFLLLVACINYVNLTTATSFRRSKEIGMRKVAGASFIQLMLQFLSEAMLISFIALLLALGLSQALLPLFNKLAGTQISQGIEFSIPLVLRLVLFVIALGIAAGIYPAFYLSGIRPIKTLKKAFLKPGRTVSLRKALVVFQFSLSIILIIATIVALQQLKFMQSRKLGFDKEQVVTIPLRNQAESQAKELIKKEFLTIAGVTETTSSSAAPGGSLGNINVLPEGLTQDRSQTMGTLIVDYDFMNTYKLEMTAGRYFSKEFGNDSSSFILNETAVRDLGWGEPQNAIGKGFNWGLGKEGRIIGVVKDFHFNSLQQKVQPLVMHILRSWFWYGNISVRVPAANPKASIAALQKSWNKILPDHPFDYSFVDENYNRQYQNEQRLSRLSMIFSVLIIFISSLGLLGLAIVAVSQRTKEIGVRKVLGASAAGITTLLSKGFLKLVAIAIIISSPIAWWVMDKWLNDFAYRVNIEWWVFGLAGLLAILIAFVTVSFQAIKVAISNPVKALRTE